MTEPHPSASASDEFGEMIRLLQEIRDLLPARLRRRSSGDAVPDPPFVSEGAAAWMLALDARTFRRLVAAGHLPAAADTDEDSRPLWRGADLRKLVSGLKFKPRRR